MNVDDRQDDAPQEPRPDEQPTEPMLRRRLTRSRTDRVIGGVAGGMGRYFNVDPIFFRIGAVALAFVGGCLLYTSPSPRDRS